MCIYLEFAVNVSLQVGKKVKPFEVHGGSLHLTESLLDLMPLDGRGFLGQLTFQSPSDS